MFLGLKVIFVVIITILIEDPNPQITVALRISIYTGINRNVCVMNNLPNIIGFNFVAKKI